MGQNRNCLLGIYRSYQICKISVDENRIFWYGWNNDICTTKFFSVRFRFDPSFFKENAVRSGRDPYSFLPVTHAHIRGGGVTFPDSDSTPVPKFLNPDPGPSRAIFQIYESDSCLDSGVKWNFWPLRNFWPIIICQLFCLSELEVAGVTFSDSDCAPVPKSLDPDPRSEIFQIWESGSCSESGYLRSNQNLPMCLLKEWPRILLLLLKLKGDSGPFFREILTQARDPALKENAEYSGIPDPSPSLIRDMHQKKHLLLGKVFDVLISSRTLNQQQDTRIMYLSCSILLKWNIF